jgi:hypothetical protein
MWIRYTVKLFIGIEAGEIDTVQHLYVRGCLPGTRQKTVLNPMQNRAQQYKKPEIFYVRFT